MNNEFSEEISKYVHLTNEAWKDIEKVLFIVNLNSKEFLLKEDEYCDKLCFLLNGYLRAYKIDNNGDEKTLYFNFTGRNRFVSDFQSFITQKKSNTFIQAITESELITIKREDLYSLYDKHPTIERLGRLVAEQNYLASLERIESLQNMTAKERYNKIFVNYPNLFLNVPNKYIASYLGVDSKYLSRIKKNVIIKN